MLEAYYNTGLTSGKGIYWDYHGDTGHGYEVGSGWTVPDSAIYIN